MKKNKFESQSGQIIIIAMIFMAILTAAATALLGYITQNLKGTRQDYYQTQALYLAEAGLNKAIESLNHDGSYNGESNTALGSGIFTVSLATINGNAKRVTATGYVPDSARPRAKRTVQATVQINTNGIAFNFGVQVGVGGLVMDNNSQVNGNVFSSGLITGGNGTITGDAAVAAGTAATPDGQWTVQNSDFNLGDLTSDKNAAESFVPSATNTLNKIQAFLKKTGTPGDLTVRIVTDNAGSPSKTVLASSIIPASKVTGSYGWIDATFANPPTLSAGTTYWIMLSVSSASSANYYSWGSDSNNGYGNGVGKYSSNWSAGNPVWNNVTGDLDYKAFMGGLATYFDGNINVGGNLRATEVRSCRAVTGTAYYDTVFSNCIASSSIGSTAAPGPQPMPISQAQIDAWEAAASAGTVLPGPTYTISSTQSLGPAVIDGDLVLTNNATLVMTGPVWVKGNISLDNNTTVVVDPSVGNAGTVLIADNPANPAGSGIVNISNNTIIQGNGYPNSFPMIMTASSNQTAAMIIANNAVSAIYYAPYGTIEVSQNAGGNQITGYNIHLDENANITYQSGLQNASFSNGPGGAWMLEPGTFVIMP